MISRLFRRLFQRPALPLKPRTGWGRPRVGTHTLYHGNETLCSKNPRSLYVVIAETPGDATCGVCHGMYEWMMESWAGS